MLENSEFQCFKKHWGKGIGTHMMNVMLAWAKENELLEKIMLKAQVENKTAIKLYEKLGFEVEGCLKKDFLVDGQYRDSIIMGLWLES